MDPRTPVIIGGGQLSQRVDRGEPPLEPIDLVAEAARRAADDAGAPGALAGVDSIRVVSILSWRYRNPGALVASRIGATPRHSGYTSAGGNTPQSLVNRTALDIAAGAADLVLIGGGEAWRTRMAYRAEGGRPPWSTEPEDTPAADPLSSDLEMSHPAEMQLGLMMPVQVYPMFESAVRSAAGRSVEAHNVVISELWSRFSAVAASNPHAWIQEAFTPEDDPRTGARQPDGRLPVHEAHELEQRRGAGSRVPDVLGRAGDRARRAPRPVGVPVVGHRRARPQVPVEPGRPVLVAGDAGGRIAGARARRHRDRRRRPRRPVLVLPVGRRDRGVVARAGARPGADGDGRAELRRRPVEQLRHARRRHDARRAAGRPGRVRAVHGERWVHHEARDGRVLDRAARRRVQVGGAAGRRRRIAAAASWRRTTRATSPSRRTP